MLRTLRRLTSSRRCLVALLPAPAALLVVGGVWAYITATGSGVAAGAAGTVNAPTNVVASTTTGTGTVGVSWDAATLASGDAVDGYVVQRFSGSTPSAACGSSSSSLVTATTCNDTSVADGTYTYKVTAVYHSWTAVSGASNSVTVVNDASPPTTLITFPTDGSYVNAASYAAGCTTPGVCGSASDASGVQSVRVSIRQGSGNYWNGSAFASATEVFQSATLGTPNGKSTSWSYALARPADGTYTVHVKATDTVGNATSSGTYSSSAGFTLDTVAPVVSLTNPTNGAYVNTTTPTFQGAAGQVAAGTSSSADSSTVTVKVYSGAAATGTPLRTLTTTAVSGAWSVAASPALAAGAQYTVQASQSDGAANTGTSSAVSFVVDTTAPAVTLTSPANTSYTNNTKPTFSGTAGQVAASTTASADSTTVHVNIYSGPDTTGTLVQTLTATESAGSWSVAPTTALTANAQYTAQATQADGAGNVGLSGARTFVVDTVAPGVTITSVTTPSNNNKPSFSGGYGTATGDNAAVSVTVYSGTGTGGTVAAGPFSATLNTTAHTWSVSALATALADGTYTAAATQTDLAGNTGTATSTFVVDTTAPSWTPSCPTSGGTYSVGGTGTWNTTCGNAIGGSATDASGVSTVQVSVQDGTGSCYGGSSFNQACPDLLAATHGTGNAWSLSLPQSKLTSGHTYHVTVKVTDAAGNISTTTYSFSTS